MPRRGSVSNLEICLVDFAVGATIVAVLASKERGMSFNHEMRSNCQLSHDESKSQFWHEAIRIIRSDRAPDNGCTAFPDDTPNLAG